ncbi:MAG: hypothetical protein AVDCRST_MAG67-2890 [uncultured Solirubrobacteraceae bacterium]|uniref:Uncharacterized protein n=1 Tax=uncultured Solirubrobacteraceae bacterium TaxID=1162706 RepID=A0A6J4T3Y3_9ACTN|nr:MAG: hypothetical protein AVDCRST_MAG67-2890 [uncultured Solirubrobacteraceae bacterium]
MRGFGDARRPVGQAAGCTTPWTPCGSRAPSLDAPERFIRAALEGVP